MSASVHALFVPTTWYIYLEPFRRVIDELAVADDQATVLLLSSVHAAVAARTAQPAPDWTADRRIPVHTLDTAELARAGPAWQLGRRFIGLVLSRRRLARYLREARPDVVVVGFDVAVTYIRMLMDLCIEQDIPVLVLAVAPLAPNSMHPDSSKGARLAWLARPVLRALKLERTVFHRGWVIGTYHRQATIAVPGPQERDQLIQQGIAPARIVVTGSPINDRIAEVRSQRADECRAAICKTLGWSSRSRLIVYCTECIDLYHGADYLGRINRSLAAAFDALPEDCKVIIKLHPRETEASTALFRESFVGERYRTVKEMEILPLLGAADLNLSHWSTTLGYAAALGIPILSIDIRHDPATSLSFGAAADALVRLTSEEAFPAAIHRMLFDVAHRAEALRLVSEWHTAHGPLTDGGSARRVADLLRGIAARRA